MAHAHTLDSTPSDADRSRVTLALHYHRPVRCLACKPVDAGGVERRSITMRASHPARAHFMATALTAFFCAGVRVFGNVTSKQITRSPPQIPSAGTV